LPACKTVLAADGENTPINWMPRDLRYVEKLATPDVTIADIIGDVDPDSSGLAAAATLSDELTTPLWPSAARGIAASSPSTNTGTRGKISGWPLQHHAEGRMYRLKGYPLAAAAGRAAGILANPEDYTARGKIITAAKTASARKFARTIRNRRRRTNGHHAAGKRGHAASRRLRGCSRLSTQLVEEIAFQARTDKARGQALRLSPAFADHRSRKCRQQRRGSAPHARARKSVVARVADLYAALPPSPENLNSNTKAS